MELGGWHRLWIVVCALYLAMIATYVVLEWPSPERVAHEDEFYRQLNAESRKKIINSNQNLEPEPSKDVIRVRMPNQHIVPFSAEFSTEELEKVAAEYWNIVEERSHKKKNEFFLYAGLLWLIPCSVIYVLGWSIGWIYRGFKEI